MDVLLDSQYKLSCVVRPWYEYAPCSFYVMYRTHLSTRLVAFAQFAAIVARQCE